MSTYEFVQKHLYTAALIGKHDSHMLWSEFVSLLSWVKMSERIAECVCINRWHATEATEKIKSPLVMKIRALHVVTKYIIGVELAEHRLRATHSLCHALKQKKSGKHIRVNSSVWFSVINCDCNHCLRNVTDTLFARKQQHWYASKIITGDDSLVYRYDSETYL